MLKAYKYRLYPNKEQKIQLAKTFFTPVELVGYENDEAGSPLALDNGEFTSKYDIMKGQQEFGTYRSVLSKF